ncbi:putative Receptor protein kinase CLAVATA1 [Quillaja saponaria]|uniref:Receptor protein kinase CLAVATA1 n=1 Tax=Quillaja saponaria TaxID=32244 RepID=A0AAD7Q8M9_QUISA|nr:putative Receptor protein kinase CLAVATA1 [Quillaja saponaria]
MVKEYGYLYLIVIVFSRILIPRASAFTNLLDVAVLQDIYRTLNHPPELKGWRLDGGDPCDESWTGVVCSGSSVLHLKIQGLNLAGYLGDQLNNLHDLKQLDISFNKIRGQIPYSLPPNATHINMASNYLSQNIPYLLPMTKNLYHLNLSHNLLSGPIGNFFTGLDNLRELFMQNNKFSGAVTYLAELPLTDLNIQDNLFSGVIPKHFQSIPNLWIGGNKFHAEDNSPSWVFSSETVPVEKNITSPPTTQSSAMENYRSPNVGRYKKSMCPGEIAFLVGGGTILATGVAIFIAIHIKRLHTDKLNSYGSSDSSLQSVPISTAIDFSSSSPEESPEIEPFNSAPALGPIHYSMGRPSHLSPYRPGRTAKMSRRRSFSRRCRFPAKIKIYTVGELRSATNSFSEENLLGEGSLGPVFKAEFPDGKILAVKNINMVDLSFKEEQFLDVVGNASRLWHPNIVKLTGYCVEHGQHLIVYESVRNLSLDDALHGEAYKPLSWGPRLWIALGVAQALDYLHSTFSPPVALSNLKASNILLDEDLVPRVCDCGLAVLGQLTSNRVKTKASEIAISDNGYIAPEHGQLGIDNTKTDIYTFGVLLLELLTGRKPFDDSRPREEQSLVKWASSRLHDSDSLDKMVDPGIRKTFAPKALSHFADIISLCVQPQMEFRPPMSEIVESLRTLLHKFNTAS